MRNTLRNLACGLGVVALGACAAQQKTSSAPEAASKSAPVAEQKTETVPQIDSNKVVVEATNLVNNDAQNFGPIYFEYDSVVLNAESSATLKKVAEYLGKNPMAAFTIEGHCDDRGISEYNIALGDRRARAAFDYLVRLGVPAARLKTLSYGEERPAVTGDSPEAWAKNRRGEFVSQKNGAVTTR